MKYMLAIYSREQAEAELTEAEQERYMGLWFKFDEEINQAVDVLAGKALHPTNTATTIRLKDGSVVSSDGPFAETKEQLGGFYLIEADDLDQAMEWASQMPHLPYGGSVEVRPVVEFDQE